MSTQSPGTPPRRRRIAGERRRPEQTMADAEQPSPEAPLAPETPKATKPAKPPKPSKPSKPPKPAVSGNPWPVFAVAAVAATVLVALALWFGLKQWDLREVREADRVESAERSASAAAERAATAALSYQHDTLDADLEAATSFMTPEYAKVFTETFDTFVRPNAPDQKAEVVAKVLATAVVAADEDRAEILVYVDQTATKTANPEPSVWLNRTTFDMVKRDGTWLVDGMSSY